MTKIQVLKKMYWQAENLTFCLKRAGFDVSRINLSQGTSKIWDDAAKLFTAEDLAKVLRIALSDPSVCAMHPMLRDAT